jgi:hypothetical protein
LQSNVANVVQDTTGVASTDDNLIHAMSDAVVGRIASDPWPAVCYDADMSGEQPQTYQGGCLCGAVRYEASGRPVVVAHCHCKNCQRGSGTGHSTGAMFPSSSVLLTGAISEFQLKSDNGNVVTRAFCGTCGSPVFGKNDGMPGYVTLTLGTLDRPSELFPQVVVFAGSRQAWDVIAPGLPTFETQPDWKPENGV